MRSPYEVLGLEEDPTLSEITIRKAYRKVALKWHPDKNPENREHAELMFKEVTSAMEILGSTEKRSEYHSQRAAEEWMNRARMEARQQAEEMARAQELEQEAMAAAMAAAAATTSSYYYSYPQYTQYQPYTASTFAAAAGPYQTQWTNAGVSLGEAFTMFDSLFGMDDPFVDEYTTVLDGLNDKMELDRLIDSLQYCHSALERAEIEERIEYEIQKLRCNFVESHYQQQYQQQVHHNVHAAQAAANWQATYEYETRAQNSMLDEIRTAQEQRNIHLARMEAERLVHERESFEYMYGRNLHAQQTWNTPAQQSFPQSYSFVNHDAYAGPHSFVAPSVYEGDEWNGADDGLGEIPDHSYHQYFSSSNVKSNVNVNAGMRHPPYTNHVSYAIYGEQSIPHTSHFHPSRSQVERNADYIPGSTLPKDPVFFDPITQTYFSQGVQETFHDDGLGVDDDSDSDDDDDDDDDSDEELEEDFYEKRLAELLHKLQVSNNTSERSTYQAAATAAALAAAVVMTGAAPKKRGARREESASSHQPQQNYLHQRQPHHAAKQYQQHHHEHHHSHSNHRHHPHFNHHHRTVHQTQQRHHRHFTGLDEHQQPPQQHSQSSTARVHRPHRRAFHSEYNQSDLEKHSRSSASSQNNTRSTGAESHEGVEKSEPPIDSKSNNASSGSLDSNKDLSDENRKGTLVKIFDEVKKSSPPKNNAAVSRKSASYTAETTGRASSAAPINVLSTDIENDSPKNTP